MRTRDEIQQEIIESNAELDGNETIRLLQLEVLLDIRDLLQPPRYTLMTFPAQADSNQESQ